MIYTTAFAAMAKFAQHLMEKKIQVKKFRRYLKK